MKGLILLSRIVKNHRLLLGVMILLLGMILNTFVIPAEFASAAEGQSTSKMEIGTGSQHVAVLKSNGTVWTWGTNSSGQLGDGTPFRNQDGTSPFRLTPAQVPGLTDVISVAAKYHRTLALKSDGTIMAWGVNSNGQLGDGTQTNRNTPVHVLGLNDVVAISASDFHSLALKSDGTVWAWGYNKYGQLGDGTNTDRATPVQVAGLKDVISISAGYLHSLVLKSDGTVWAWGANFAGELGDGTNTDRLTPVQAIGLSDVKSISAGSLHSLALKSDGTVWSWGDNYNGQLGDGTETNRATPMQVPGLKDAISISGGTYHSLVLRSDGTVWTWGYNDGRLGDGTTVSRKTPVQAIAPTEGVSVSSSGYSMLLLSDGTIWAAGKEFYANVNSTVFAQVQGFGTVQLTATASNSTTVDLTYGANVDVAKFVVKRGSVVLSCPQTGTNPTCQDQGLTPGTSYTYTVEAYDASNNLIDSKSQTVTPGGSQVPKITVIADKPTVSVGTLFTTSVKVEQAEDLYAEDVTISYDPTLFTFVQAEAAETGLKIYHQSETTPGTVRVVVASQGTDHGLNGTAQLLKLTLQAKNVAGKGTIAASQGLVANSQGEEIVPTLGDTEITVFGSNGDVNGDGRISLGDLAIAGHHFGMEKLEWTHPNADVDGNDDVNDLDLSAIVEAIFANSKM